jgi:hypothetical protein
MTQWSFWVMTEIEKPQLLAAALRVLFDPHEPDGEELELALAKLARPWTALDGYLQDREFLVGERFTAADLNVAAVMHMVPVAGIDISRWPFMARRLEACLARPAAAFGAFFNQGQICMSTERIIVVVAVADAFAEKFSAKAATLTAGNPAEGKNPLGAVIGLETVEKAPEPC